MIHDLTISDRSKRELHPRTNTNVRQVFDRRQPPVMPALFSNKFSGFSCISSYFSFGGRERD
jgi:hypothetical protein